MRLFIPDINLSEISLKLISKYLVKSDTIEYFYSDNGIFSINNNKIIKYKIIDKNKEDYKLHVHNNEYINCIIDNSLFIIDEEYYQLPINHYSYVITKEYYILRENALVKLIIERYNNKIIDFYFIIKNNNTNINEDILTFLFDLSFIKNI